MRSILCFVALLAACAPVASTPPPAADSRTDVVLLAAERLDNSRYRLILQNGYNGPVGYNLCASALQRWVNSAWQPVETGEICTMELRSLPAGQDATFEKRLPDGAGAGRYRYTTRVEIPSGTSSTVVATPPFDVK